MRLIQLANNAASKLSANVSNSGTSISVTPGEGSKFPSLTGSQYFMATMVRSDGSTEIVKVTARSTDAMTIARAAEPVGGVATAFSFSAGDKFEARLTAGELAGELDRLDSLAIISPINKSANYTVTEADVTSLIRCNSGAGGVTITLPAISTLVQDFDIIISKVTSDANVVAVNRSSSDTINGAAVYNLTAQWQSVWLIADRSTNTWTAINSGSGVVNAVVDPFTGAGSAGPFTLSAYPGSVNNIAVFVGGVYQQKSTLTLVGTSLTLGSAVTTGVAIEACYTTALPIGTPSDGAVSTAKLADGAVSTAKLAAGIFSGYRLFKKTVRRMRLFTSPSANTLQTQQQFYVEVSGIVLSFAANTSVVMPALTAGTDYAIYACADGTLRADANFTNPTGYTTANSRFIGSAHYAPGGNATAQSGGNTTPAFNPYSLFDLTYCPSVNDWRGLTTEPGLGRCGMIYLLNTNPDVNGPSKYNVTIADGANPPKVPAAFGGNGTTTYADGNWWNLTECLRAYGFQPPTVDEYAALAYGTTEASSVGTDQGSTILNAAYTSKCGVIQASGVMWIWGANFGGGAAGAGWTANTQGRGSTYQLSNAVILGGAWDEAAHSGSRASAWINSPTISYSRIGARGVCDLLILD